MTVFARVSFAQVERDNFGARIRGIHTASVGRHVWHVWPAVDVRQVCSHWQKSTIIVWLRLSIDYHALAIPRIIAQFLRHKSDFHCSGTQFLVFSRDKFSTQLKEPFLSFNERTLTHCCRPWGVMCTQRKNLDSLSPTAGVKAGRSDENNLAEATKLPGNSMRKPGSREGHFRRLHSASRVQSDGTSMFMTAKCQDFDSSTFFAPTSKISHHGQKPWKLTSRRDQIHSVNPLFTRRANPLL